MRIILAVVSGLAGGLFLLLVVLSFFMGGTWGARVVYGLFGIGGVALAVYIVSDRVKGGRAK